MPSENLHLYSISKNGHKSEGIPKEWNSMIKDRRSIGFHNTESQYIHWIQILRYYVPFCHKKASYLPSSANVITQLISIEFSV